VNVNATIIGQLITFWILIWFVMKFVWGPITSMMEARTKRIADGLAAGERGKHELELAAKRGSEVLVEAKQKAAEIIAQAEKRASEIVEEAKGDAKTEGDRLLAGAKAEIEQEVYRAKEGLRQQVADLAVAGAEKILRREIDAKAHAALLSTIKNEL
jgi:F-type H+-transporting ATPase subunit b